MAKRFVDTLAFEKLCNGVFHKMDKDGSGTIDRDELTIAMCHLHYKLAKKSPGVTEPPTPDVVSKTMQEYDMDQSGTLDKKEFLSFAKRWFDTGGAVFFRRLVTTAFISMVVLPESASILHREVPAARQIPKAAFKVLFGVVFKFVAMRLPGR